MAFNLREPRTQRLTLIFLVIGVVLYGYFFTDLLPFTYKANAQELGRLEDQYRDISKDLNKARQAVHRLPYLEKEAELLQRKREQGKALRPADKDMVGILRTITVLGTNAGVYFTKFEPKPLRAADGYTEVPIAITVVGGYHEIGSFLGEIANMSRILNVADLDIEAVKKNRSTDQEFGDKSAEASFTAIAYTMGVDPAAVAQTPPASGSPRPPRPAGASGQGGGE
jgi:type IV pilus assembly protein PilO